MGTIFLILLWATGIGATLWGTWYALRQARKKGLPTVLPPISILKPVKGIDAGLFDNLLGFFHLDYPVYEIIFSIDSATDPARPVIEALMACHLRIPSRLIIGEGTGGKSAANPKVDNLLASYPLAKFETILISDSNVRVPTGYLKEVVAELKDDVGIVTAVVAGTHPKKWGGYLEATYLNTFYTRWMYLAQACGVSTVVGKSMLFRKSTFDRLGGIQTFGCYIAEDYMAGRAMYHLGMKVAIMPTPVPQFIGCYSFKSFWQRHLRWGRIRKSHAPIAFAAEPIFMTVVSGILGALAAQRLGFSFFGFLALHLFLWFLSDCWLMRRMGTLRPFIFFSWWMREALALPLWLHMALGNSVAWRGQKLTLFPGGILGELEESA